MTNEAFLSRLQTFTVQEQNEKTTVDFAVAYLEGCAEELKIYAMCITAAGNPDDVHPLFVGEPEQKMMLCYTSAEEAEKFHRELPDTDKRQLLCMPVPAHTVLDTVMSHPEATAIGFDMDGDHAFLLPKPVLVTLMKQRA